jgi:hypothetical protein
MGSPFSGVLERATPQPRPAVELDDAQAPADDGLELDVDAGRGRGAARRPRPPAARAAKKAKARTVYIDDALFERVLVQAHRKGCTISDYVSALVRKYVPDHRGGRSAEPTDTPAG